MALHLRTRGGEIILPFEGLTRVICAWPFLYFIDFDKTHTFIVELNGPSIKLPLLLV